MPSITEFDQICDDFERRWLAGETPSILEFLNKTATADQPQLLVHLVPVDVEFRLRSGKPVQPSDYADFGADAVNQAGQVIERFQSQSIQLSGVPAKKSAAESESTMIKQSDSDANDRSTDDERDQPDLSFLEPSNQTGSIGRLGHYEIRGVIGHGGFGVVFKAFDDKLQRLVAIKALLPHLAATSPPRKRFLREARAAAGIRHEHVVRVYSVEEQPVPYLVMEFIDGETLKSLVDARGPFDTDEVVRIATQIANGLQAAHAQGLIHRDIKPANILLERGVPSKVKITDFGLARTADDASLTQSGVIAGTPQFMSPEQASGQDMDHRSDLFSLGSVIYTMACGHSPFRAPTTVAILRRVAEDTPRPLRNLQSSIPDYVQQIVGKLLAKNPDDRFQSAEELLVSLTTKAVSSRSKNGTTNYRRKTIAVLLVSTLVLSAIAVVFTIFHQQESNFELPITQDQQNGISVETSNQAKLRTGITEFAIPLSLDASVAHWTCSLGGTVMARTTTGIIAINRDQQVPDEDFEITEISLESCSSLTDQGLHMLGALKSLDRVTLSRTQVTDSGLAFLSTLPALRQIYLSATKVSGAGFSDTSGFSHLEYLNCNSSQLDDNGLAVILRLPKIASLDLVSTKVTDRGIAHFESNTTVKELSLGDTRITDVGVASLSKAKQLKFLSLNETRITDRGIEHLANLPALERLDLTRTKMTNDGLKFLTGLQNLKQLRISEPQPSQDVEEEDKSGSEQSAIAAFRSQRPDVKLEILPIIDPRASRLQDLSTETTVVSEVLTTFGMGANAFRIQFVAIPASIDSSGSLSNATLGDRRGNPSGAGHVPYPYLISKYEISEDAVAKANGNAELNVTHDVRSPGKPATSVSWFEAARFVNWLNTSTGNAPAYKFTGNSFALWDSSSPMDYDPMNPFRSIRTRFALPTCDEWYKSAYFDPGTNTFLNFPTGSNNTPSPSHGSTISGDAIFGNQPEVAEVNNAGGPSPFGTIGQGGNVYEWEESTFDLKNNSPTADRAYRGGNWTGSADDLSASARFGNSPAAEEGSIGFRIVMLQRADNQRE